MGDPDDGKTDRRKIEEEVSDFKNDRNRRCNLRGNHHDHPITRAGNQFGKSVAKRDRREPERALHLLHKCCTLRQSNNPNSYMSLLDRFSLLLTDPDYAMSDQYESPALLDAFWIVSLYALLSALRSLIDGAIVSGSFGVGFLSFILSFLLVYVTWVFLTLFMHVIADFWGGLGELPNAASAVGLAAAPMVVTSLLSLLVTGVGHAIMEGDETSVISMVNLILNWLGMVWGWPGVLCYFGLKHGERITRIKAAVIVSVAFCGMAVYEIVSMNI